MTPSSTTTAGSTGSTVGRLTEARQMTCSPTGKHPTWMILAGPWPTQIGPIPNQPAGPLNQAAARINEPAATAQGDPT